MGWTRTRRILTALVLGVAAASGPHAGEWAGPLPLRLVLRVPAYRLDVYEGGALTRTYVVAVGKPGHRTPAGSYRITRVIWNPWWHPPASRWARGRRPVPPGPRNPMGRVKMYFRNLYYIHGTPDHESLGRPASHGCVRMSNRDAVELARLVHRYGSPDVSPTELDALVRNRRQTRTIWLKRPVPFLVVYRRTRAGAGPPAPRPEPSGLTLPGVPWPGS